MSRQGPRLHRLPKRTDYILIPPPLDLTLPLVDEKSPLPAIIVTPSSPSSSRDFAIAFLADPPKPSLRERFLSTFFPSSSSSSSSPCTSRTSSNSGARTGPIALASNTPTPLTDAERKPLFRLVSTSTSGGNSNSHSAPGTGGSLRRLRTRSIMLILLVLFVLLCHLVTHRLAVRSGGPYLDLDVDVPATAYPGSDSEFGMALEQEEERETKGVQGWFEVLLGPFGVSSSSSSDSAQASRDPKPDTDMDTDADIDLDLHAEPEFDFTPDIEEGLSTSAPPLPSA